MSEEIRSASFFIGKGDDTLISFGSGQPDLPPPPQAFDILKTYTSFKYGLVQGEEALRAELAKGYPGAKADEFVITNGASEAIDLVLRCLAQPGGKVLLPRPYYYSYPYNVRFAGMEPVYYDLNAEGKIDFDVFAKAVEGCVAVIINSPSNPTGTVQEIETLKQIETLCEKLGVYVISDEVYKDIIYVRENYLIQGSRVVTINTFSKTYAMCGLRVGYAYSRDHELIKKMIEMKSHTAMNTSIVGQQMALAALSAPQSYIAHNVEVWRARRDLMYEGMKALGLELWKPEGAFYVLPKIRQSNRALNDLYHKYKIITYDGEWFGAPDHLRFSYALDASKITEGLRRLKEFLDTDYTAY
ncbi:MAG TPA: pyridoxal phosphate-dependent aminotransferase [Candidatus Paceibacterota bacterium]|nr:pyridoxal phosphate-dependent aminotransferase [Candidatus Paceibacterota bacterium]